MAIVYRYVDSSVGSSGDGTIGTPWKLLSNIKWTSGANNIKAIVDGGNQAVINLKRGSIWREIFTLGYSGGSTNWTIIQPYGSGNPPEIQGDAPISAVGQFADQGSNVAKKIAPLSVVAATCNFDGIWGELQANAAACVKYGDFYVDGSKYLYVYCPSGTDPYTFYGTIHPITIGVSGTGLLSIPSIRYFNIYGLAFRWFNGNGIYLSGTSDHVYLYNNIVDGGNNGAQNQGINASLASCTDVKIINALVVGCYNRNIITGNGTIAIQNTQSFSCYGPFGIYGGSSSTNFSNSHIASSFLLFTAGTDEQNYATATDGGNNLMFTLGSRKVQDAPRLMASNFNVPISYCIDDASNYPNPTTAMAYIDSILSAFSSRGLKLTLAIVASACEHDAAQAAKVKHWAKLGHDVVSHSWSHTDFVLGLASAFTIKYTGSGTVCLFNITETILTTTVDGHGDLNINLASVGTYNEIADLVAAINAHGNYTAVATPNPTVYPAYAHAVSLADQTIANIKSGSGIAVSFDKTRLLTDEVVTSKAYLEALITGAGIDQVPDYTCTSYVCPVNSTDPSLESILAAANYLGNTGKDTWSGNLEGGTGEWLSYKGVGIHKILRLLTSDFNNQTAQVIDARMGQLFMTCNNWGIPVNLYNHVSDAVPPVTFNLMLDAILKYGQYKCLTDKITWLRGLTQKGVGGKYVTKPTGINYNKYRSKAGYIGINAGVNVGLPFRGSAPDIGPYEVPLVPRKDNLMPPGQRDLFNRGLSGPGMGVSQ